MLNWVQIRELDQEDGSIGGYYANLGPGTVTIMFSCKWEVELDKAPDYDEGWLVAITVSGELYQRKYVKTERAAKRWATENERLLKYQIEQLA